MHQRGRQGYYSFPPSFSCVNANLCFLGRPGQQTTISVSLRWIRWASDDVVGDVYRDSIWEYHFNFHQARILEGIDDSVAWKIPDHAPSEKQIPTIIEMLMPVTHHHPPTKYLLSWTSRQTVLATAGSFISALIVLAIILTERLWLADWDWTTAGIDSKDADTETPTTTAPISVPASSYFCLWCHLPMLLVPLSLGEQIWRNSSRDIWKRLLLAIRQLLLRQSVSKISRRTILLAIFPVTILTFSRTNFRMAEMMSVWLFVMLPGLLMKIYLWLLVNLDGKVKGLLS